MLPPFPADLTLLASWSAHTIRTDLTESRAQAQHICAEATATCASAAEIGLEQQRCVTTLSRCGPSRPSTWQQGYADVRKVVHGRRRCCRSDVAAPVPGAR